MSSPDYNQRAEDHQALLVLVKQIGPQISQKTFNKIFDQISRVQHVKIQDTAEQRGIWLRYRKYYTLENNDWGDFQSHRKVLGLLSVGKCNSQVDVEELCRYHSIFRDQYSSTLYDSRCLLFGMGNSTDIAHISQKSSEDSDIPLSPPPPPPSPAPPPFFSDGKVIPPMEGFKNNGGDPMPNLVDSVDDKDSGVYEQLNSFAEHETCAQEDKLPQRQMDSPSSTSNGKALQYTNILVTPFDGGDRVIRDPSLNSICSTTSSSSSTTLEGSSSSSPACSKKLSLPSVKSQSIHCILYPGVDDCDNLELDLFEFASSLFWVLEAKRLDRSFEKQDKIPLLTAVFEKKDFVGLDKDSKTFKKRCLGRMKKHVGDLALQASLPLEALSLYSSAYDLLKPLNDWQWLAAILEGQCASSVVLLCPPTVHSPSLHRNSSFPVGNHSIVKIKAVSQTRSLPNGIDPAEYKSRGKSLLSVDDIIEKYRTAISYYKKCQHTAIVETECSIKASRAMISLEKYVEVAEFLQNVVFANLAERDEEKIDRYCALSQLYSEIGFHRKASFLKRMAAMKCLSNVNPDWLQSYLYLLQTLEGYKLSLEPKEFPRDIPYGWPGIQIQVLQDLIRTSRKMGNQAVAVRHLTFLLHTLSEHLSHAECKEYCAQLETLTTKCEGAPVPLALENGLIIPPVNLINLPSVKNFKLQEVAPHLRPVKMSVKVKSTAESSGPFIFSPLLIHKEKLLKEKSKLDFKWVEGDVCEVALQLFNPLPFELKVSHMGLLADGIAFESFPASLILPAESGPYPVNLLGTPLGTGELQILGYTTHVLGVKSNCRLRDIPNIKKPYFSVTVIPRLPQLQVSTSLPKASTFSSLKDTSHVVISAALTVYAGESRECTITLTNSGKEMVEKVVVSLQTKLDKAKEASFFTWSKENLDAQLPIHPGKSASFTLYINAVGEFVNQVKQIRSGPTASHFGVSNAPVRSSPSVLGTPVKKKLSVFTSPEPFPPQNIEAVLQLQYSGGPGMKAKYSRQCAVSINLEVQPSVVITKWDVLPAEVPTRCYLVFDVLNATNYEMELQYAANKCIAIEACDSCRIPVPVERFPLTSTVPISESEEDAASLEASCSQHLVSLVDMKWCLPAIDISGKASIADVTWSEEMLNLILMSPVQWDILLNGKQFKIGEEFTFTAGELISINIKIYNMSETSISSLNVCIQGYQDHQNGFFNYCLEDKRALIGSDKILIKEIPSHEMYCHDCGFVFFHMGVYKLSVQCSSDADVPVERRELSSGLYRSSDQGSHIWKCTPPIEINIVEV